MKEKKSRKEWIKTVAIIFLSVLLVLTFFSNTIMNYSLPEVSAQYVYSGTVTNKVRGSGVVEASDPYEVILKEERTVESVAVKEGDSVEKGDVIYYLSEGESTELTEAEKTLAELESEYEQAIITGAVSTSVTNDLEKNGTGDVAANQAKLEAAKKLVETRQAAVDSLTKQSNEFENASSSYVTEKKALEEAEENLENWKAQNEEDGLTLSTAKEEYDAAATAVNETQAKIDEIEKLLKNLPKDVSSNEYENYWSYYFPGKATYEVDYELSDLKSDLKTLKKTCDSKKTAYSTALSNYNTSSANVAAYTKAVEDAQNAITDKTYSLSKQLTAANEALEKAQKAYDELMSDLSTKYGLEDKLEAIEEQKKTIEKLKENSSEGTVTAPIAGTIDNLSYKAGQTIETGSTVATIQREGDEYTLTMSVTMQQSKLLSIGDEAEVSNSWWYSDIHARITQIRPDKSNPTSSKLVVFELEGTDLADGQSLTLTVGNRTANYDIVVPNSAIREDNNGKFVLKVNSKDTPLGTRYIAERVDVTVLAEDDTNSAISGNMDSWEYIITTSTKPIESGDQVRLKD